MKCRRLPSVIACLFACCVFLAPATAGGRPLARVDGQPLAAEDLERSFARRHSGHTAFLAGESEVRRALDNLIDRTLLIHEAERLKLGSLPGIEAEVTALADRLSVKHLLEVEINEPAQPSEEEIRAAHERFTDHLLKVRQIVVSDRAEAEEIAALLDQGEPFEELARERSQARSRQAGGLMPPVGWGAVGAAWDEVAFNSEAGEASAPFRNGATWEIVRVEERLSVERPEYEQAYSKIKGILLKRKLEALERSFADRLHAKYEVAVELSPFESATYTTALGRDEQTVVASWKAGELRIGELAELADFGTLESLSAGQAAADIEALVRTAVTARLMRLEARERKYEELPDIRARLDAHREAAMLAVLHEELIFRDLTVADAEICEWYDSNPDKLRIGERRMVAQILVATEQEARMAKARLDEETPYPELAQELSTDTASAARGGTLGWIGEKDSPQGFEEVFTLAEMEVSQPLQSELGWHLIRVLQIEPARIPALDEATPQIRDGLLKARQQAARREWLAQLRDNAKIKINSKAVRAFAADHAPEQAPPPSH